MDRNLAIELVRVTEFAALAAAKHIGRGDEKIADQAAVDAMRTSLNAMTIEGTERLLPTETLNWRPGAVSLRIHPEISTLGLSSNQVDALCNQVEAVTRGNPLPQTEAPTPSLET